MLELARAVLGEEIRYDHCVNLSREGGNRGEGWHTHPYATDWPDLGFIRIFYVSGYQKGNGSLKVVPGSHVRERNRLWVCISFLSLTKC
jgi:hypothetical protein